jgi:hypothetical protein
MAVVLAFAWPELSEIGFVVPSARRTRVSREKLFRRMHAFPIPSTISSSLSRLRLEAPVDARIRPVAAALAPPPSSFTPT